MSSTTATSSTTDTSSTSVKSRKTSIRRATSTSMSSMTSICEQNEQNPVQKHYSEASQPASSIYLQNEVHPFPEPPRCQTSNLLNHQTNLPSNRNNIIMPGPSLPGKTYSSKARFDLVRPTPHQTPSTSARWLGPTPAREVEHSRLLAPPAPTSTPPTRHRKLFLHRHRHPRSRRLDLQPGLNMSRLCVGFHGRKTAPLILASLATARAEAAAGTK